MYQVAIGFGFASDWFSQWRIVFKQSQSVVKVEEIECLKEDNFQFSTTWCQTFGRQAAY